MKLVKTLLSLLAVIGLMASFNSISIAEENSGGSKIEDEAPPPPPDERGTDEDNAEAVPPESISGAF